MTKKKQVRVVLQPQTNKKKTKLKKEKEVTRLGRALRTLGGLGGATVGGLIGMPASGASMGSGIGAALSKWLGSGDYQVSSNSMVSAMKASGSIPMMHKNDQTVVVRHKEFIGEIRSAQNYTVQYSLELNPGVANTFPWLSNIAKNYQEYRFKGVVFHYVPTSGSAISSTNNALGSVMMQTSYRATDTPPDTKRELLNEYWSTETSPAETTCHPIECNPAENPFNVQYVRQTDVPIGDNLLLYDLGRTYVATSGQQADNIPIGDLWVTYEVELKKPTLYSNVTASDASIIGYGTAASTAVKAGTYLDVAITSVNRYVGTLTPTITSSRTFQIPERFEGYVYVFCRLNSPVSPWFDANGVTWDNSATLSGSIIAAPVLAGDARWGIVNEANIGASARSITWSAAFIKTNAGSAAPASITIPQCVFTAGGTTTMTFKAVIMLINASF
nr:structural protein [Tolivirales sp.]